ncbi:MAG: S-layer protein, partial [Centipeda sp. (in: firmicutes)]
MYCGESRKGGNTMKKTMVAALAAAMTIGAASTTFAAANPFSDVPRDHWAYDAV